MEITTPTEGGSKVLELPANLDLTVAGPLAEALSKGIGEDLVLDGGKVQRLGASCLQVLLAAARTWISGRLSLTLENPSSRMLADLRLLGFEPSTFLDGANAT